MALLIEPRAVKLTTRTGVSVNRTLPHRDLKMIGPWCFVDHFGPTEQVDGMVVAAHPHTGLQTVTWLLEGHIEHRDSIGSVQQVQPGQLNLMTAGRGIAHSEISLDETKLLHAVQLWVALPDASRAVEPAFEHRNDLPIVLGGEWKATVLAGEFLGERAKTKTFSAMLGVELRLEANARMILPITPGFEYGLLNVEGELASNGIKVERSALLYYSVDEAGQGIELVAGETGATILVLAGEPFGERILMWWNFIARSNDEIVAQRELWNSHLDSEAGKVLYPEFEDRIGGWTPAPELPNVKLKPRL